jgi:tRNA nucleotidyltransferase (CCA-adding enzyme)
MMEGMKTSEKEFAREEVALYGRELLIRFLRVPHRIEFARHPHVIISFERSNIGTQLVPTPCIKKLVIS